MMRCVLGSILISLQLTGCAGYLGGELGSMEPSKYRVPQCNHEVTTKYSYTVSTNIENGGKPGLARSISEWSFGLIPTYRPVFGVSEVQLRRDGSELVTYHYEATVHEFYGLFWPLLLTPVNWFVDESNHIPANEGVGLASAWGVRDKTSSVAFEQIIRDQSISKSELCYEYVFEL